MDKIKNIETWKKTTIYYSVGLLLALLMVIIYLLGLNLYPNNYILLEVIETLYKTIIIVILSYILIKNNKFKEMFEGKYFHKILFISLIYILYNVLCNLAPINLNVNIINPILGFFGVLTTAIWEEIYFRHFGKILYVDNNKLTKENIIILTIGFAIPHLANIVVSNILNIIVLFALSSSMALVLMPIYLKTKNILVPITIHFLLNISSQFFVQFVKIGQTSYLGNYSLIINIVLIIFNIIFGIYLYKKYNLIK